jgi:hypothetical protein
MFMVDKKVGRLIEARIASPLSEDDIQDIVQRVRMNVLSMPGKVICCADLTQLDAIPRESVDSFIQLFTRDNSKVERSAFLLSRSLGALGMQMQRMIRSAGNSSRMTFDDARALQEWLAPALTSPEKARLQAFFEGAG